MTREPITVESDTLVDDAANIMLKKNISCLRLSRPRGILKQLLKKV